MVVLSRGHGGAIERSLLQSDGVTALHPLHRLEPVESFYQTCGRMPVPLRMKHVESNGFVTPLLLVMLCLRAASTRRP